MQVNVLAFTGAYTCVCVCVSVCVCVRTYVLLRVCAFVWRLYAYGPAFVARKYAILRTSART